MISSTSRAIAIAAAVPPLRNVFLRALSTSAATSQLAPQHDPHYTPLRPRGSLHIGNMGRTSDERFKDDNKRRPQKRSRLAARQSSVSPSSQQPAKDGPYYQGGHLRYPQNQPYKHEQYPLPQSDLGGEDAEPRKFEDFDVNLELLESLYDRYSATGETTMIQSLALKHFADNQEPGSRTILGAETGSGKTLAYLLPIMTQLKATEINRPSTEQSRHQIAPRCLVLSPTHELVRQSTGMAKSLSYKAKLRVKGMSNTRDGGIGETRGDVDFLLGTGSMSRRMLGVNIPGAMSEEGLKEKTSRVDLERLEWVVIDEADVLLGRDFRHETLATLSHIMNNRPDVKLVLCTATFPPALLQNLRQDPLLAAKPFTHLLSPALHKLPKNLEARFVPFHYNSKRLADVVHEVKRTMSEDAQKRKEMLLSGKEVDRSKVIVFCNSDKRVDLLSKELEAHHLPNLAWTGDAASRVKGSNGPLKTFLLDPRTDPSTALLPGSDATPPPRILVTTGILSRGLDFSPLVSTVFLVDQPKDILDFMHRAGRAGRAGRKGKVVIFGMDPGANRGGEIGRMVNDVIVKRDRNVGKGKPKPERKSPSQPAVTVEQEA